MLRHKVLKQLLAGQSVGVRVGQCPNLYAHEREELGCVVGRHMYAHEREELGCVVGRHMQSKMMNYRKIT